MATLNHPDKFVLDAYSDPQLETYNPNGVYSRWTNQLKTPILNARGVQLINANLVNSVLQLNDQSQLAFYYYASATQANMCVRANLRCVRLLPSNYVAWAGFTAYTKNRYFNNVVELVAALNQAASAGGDSVIYNTLWVADQIVFSYDTNTRKISVAAKDGTSYIAPAAADDPNVIDAMTGASFPPSKLYMYTYGNGAGVAQPYVVGQSMNARLGFAMSYNSRGAWWSATSQIGCATSTGVPQLSGTAIEADANPILIGSQNVNVYLSIVTGSGLDSWSGRKNLVATIPLDVAPLNINSYTTNSAEVPAISVPNEIYEISVELYDDQGTPFYQPPNYNTELTFSVYY